MTLLASPLLEDLSLTGLSKRAVAGQLNPVPSLGSLRSLRLEEEGEDKLSDILPALVTPNLQSLALGSQNLETVELAPFVLSVSPTLKSLALRSSIMSPRSGFRLIPLIADASPPSLQTLIFGAYDEFYDDASIPLLNQCKSRLLEVLKERLEQADLDPIQVLELETPGLGELIVRAGLEKIAVLVKEV